jgi:hypothetical protein
MAVTKEASVSATPQFRDFTTLYKDSVPIPLPVNANDVRRYTDGANSIVNVIPSPTIKKRSRNRDSVCVPARGYFIVLTIWVTGEV